ncbi:MAG: hypothetical protein PHO91_04330 [Patescibacteria group bacterium]|nr:hypothetical protein [Patescibacteria group bacterium]
MDTWIIFYGEDPVSSFAYQSAVPLTEGQRLTMPGKGQFEIQKIFLKKGSSVHTAQARKISAA